MNIKNLIPQKLKDVAYTAGAAGRFSGVPLRTVQYWTEREIIKPAISDTTGTGSKRLYSALNCIEIAIVKKLAADRMSLNEIKALMHWLKHPADGGLGKLKYKGITVLEVVLMQNPGLLIRYHYDEGRTKNIQAFKDDIKDPKMWQILTSPAMDNRDYLKVEILNLTKIAKKVLEKMA